MGANDIIRADQATEAVRKSDCGGGWRPQRFSHIVTNGEQIDRLNASGEIPVDFAGIAERPVHLAFSGLQSRTISVWTTSSLDGFKSTPKISADLFTLRFVTAGSLIRHNLISEAVISRVDFGTLVDFEDMQDEQASSAFSSVSATVSRVTIASAKQALDDEESTGPSRFVPFVELKTAGLRALRQSVVALHGWLSTDPLELDFIAPMLEELVVYQLISTWPMIAGFPFIERAASSRALKRAVDYMEANLHRQMTMQEIARASGISVRGLQGAFKRELRQSPISWLIDRRLDNVRAALLNPKGQTIRQIALHWGFVHMSDFSMRYRKRFGQLPSAAKQASHDVSSF